MASCGTKGTAPVINDRPPFTGLNSVTPPIKGRGLLITGLGYAGACLSPLICYALQRGLRYEVRFMDPKPYGFLLMDF